MDVRTPALILLCSLLAALAFSVLGLAADNVAYVNSHQDDTIDIHYLRWNQTADAPYSYWVQMDYLPSRFSLGRIEAMLATSIITTVIAIIIAFVSWTSRGANAAQAGLTFKKRQHSVPWTLISLILASIAFAISLAVAIYAWYPVMQWSIDFKKSLPLPSTISNSNSKTVKYQSPFDLVPELWNCWISDYTVDPAVGGRLHNLCREADIAKILMLPVVILSAALAVGVGLSWWKSSRAATSTTETNEKDVEEVSI